MNIGKELTQNDINELLKDEEILYLLEDLKKSKEYQDNIKITLVLKKGKIIPIEVKSSNNTRSKSLDIYIKKYKPEYSIRISAKNFGFENNIKSVPLYAVFCL